MKVTVSVGGLFHAPPLIKYLMDQGLEVEFITSYPRYILKKRGIKASKIKTIWIKEILYQGYKKIFGKFPNNYLSSEVFDRIASYRISLDSNIYIIWAGFALHTIKRIRKYNPNAKIILERGSTHIEFQNEVLCRAYKEFDINNTNIVPAGIIKKEKAEYYLTDYIAIPSDFVYKTFIDKGVNSSKLFVNPYGVDLHLFVSQNDGTELQNVFTVTFVGLFSVQKGAFTFFQILDYFVHRTDIHFMIVGNIESLLKKRVEHYIKAGILSYHSSVPIEQLPGYYSKSSIFLLPSVQEGLAMVILQAMASSLPVLSTPNSGAEMLITDGDEGFIIPLNDALRFIEKIEYLFSNPGLRISMGDKARNRVLEGYSWTDYGHRNLVFYNNIVSDEKR